MSSGTLLGIDAGTTGITVILYDLDLRVLRRGYAEFGQHYPHPGWVEHDADEIRDVALRLIAEVGADAPAPIRAVGITNQRETVVPFDVETGAPLARAIVWQCRRTTDLCARLEEQGLAATYRDATGLLLDPYFSGTKMRWLLENDDAVAAAAGRGALRFATVDAFLVHGLTGGSVFATDPTNASRTLLFDIDARSWSPDLMGPLSVTEDMLPEVRPSASSFGMTRKDLVGFEAPISGIAGDQQAALFGQGCFEPGAAKNTYGTGCFLLMVAGEKRPTAPEGLLTTLAAGPDGKAIYALEGSVFAAGAAVQWLRDELGIISEAAETEALAASLDDNEGVYLVPAFSGLGAPYWAPEARGVLSGLTRGTGRAHIARAALESIAYQSAALISAIHPAVDGDTDAMHLRVDGGACANDWLMQFQADVLGMRVLRSADLETTSRGAALLAGVGAGVIDDPRTVAALHEDCTVFEPTLPEEARRALLRGWDLATTRARLTDGA